MLLLVKEEVSYPMTEGIGIGIVNTHNPRALLGLTQIFLLIGYDCLHEIMVDTTFVGVSSI